MSFDLIKNFTTSYHGLDEGGYPFTFVGITQGQPIVAYQLGDGWALSAGDLQFTYDWERGGWVSVPIGFQVGVVRPVARQPVRFALDPQWNLRNVTGAPKVQLTFTVTLLAPAK